MQNKVQAILRKKNYPKLESGKDLATPLPRRDLLFTGLRHFKIF